MDIRDSTPVAIRDQMDSSSLDKMVIALVPSLSRSLAEQFNVLRVMHHGTHEKQLSNAFAWLLRVDGTHRLEDTFQRLFVERVNGELPEGRRLPTSGYSVHQEVDTSGHDSLGKDIADIVLTSAQASFVIENFETSDGHGHDYNRYLTHGAAGGTKQSVVVLLCAKRERHRQTDGWENAIVVTYADLLGQLRDVIASKGAWRRTHQQQHFFVEQLVEHFVEGPKIMSDEERVAFIKAMCETGESARYGYRPHERAGQEFADLVAQHAKRQFEEGRGMLAEAKRSLKRFAEQTLTAQVNGALPSEQITSVEVKFVGQWEWCVGLRRPDPKPMLFLEFGPTAVVENARAPEPLEQPDYGKVFVTRRDPKSEGIDYIAQTDVALDDVLRSLSPDDVRLCNAVLYGIRPK